MRRRFWVSVVLTIPLFVIGMGDLIPGAPLERIVSPAVLPWLPLQVFDYATLSAAEAEASRVSADGTTIGTSKPTWMATPHFFKSGKLIVIYTGGNQTIVDLLRTTLGNQFVAGRCEPSLQVVFLSRRRQRR